MFNNLDARMPISSTIETPRRNAPRLRSGLFLIAGLTALMTAPLLGCMAAGDPAQATYSSLETNGASCESTSGRCLVSSFDQASDGSAAYTLDLSGQARDSQVSVFDARGGLIDTLTAPLPPPAEAGCVASHACGLYGNPITCGTPAGAKSATCESSPAGAGSAGKVVCQWINSAGDREFEIQYC